MSLSKARAIEGYPGRGRKKWLFLGILVVVLLIIGFAAIREVGLVYSPKDVEGVQQTLEIKSGSSTAEMADQLVAANLISSSRSFKLAVLLDRAKGQLKAGTYEFSASLSPHEMVQDIQKGATKQIQVTIPEGLRLDQVADIFAQAGLSDKRDILAAARANKFKYPFLKSLAPGANLEGFWFPDTYNYDLKTDSASLIDKMLANFQQKIKPLLPSIEKSDLSLNEIVTLASMVEKEVSEDKDRKLVAGVFLNRKENGMPLQSDSTLAFIKKKEQVDFSPEDIAADSPYNTYQNIGLPPGPINSPSLSALQAVLEPTTSDYLYFVSDLETGKTYYSKTLQEHNQNVAKYLGR